MTNQKLVFGPALTDLDSPAGRLLCGQLQYHPTIWLNDYLIALSCFTKSVQARALTVFQAGNQRVRFISATTAIWVRCSQPKPPGIYIPGKKWKLQENDIQIFPSKSLPEHFTKIGPLQVATWERAITDLFIIKASPLTICRCLFAAASTGRDVPLLLKTASQLDSRRKKEHTKWLGIWNNLVTQNSKRAFLTSA